MNNFIDIDWRTFLLGSENWVFLVEAALRSLVMFVVILTGLHFLGKRGLKQLSVFELGVIIGLGSAAGDPMFYKDVGLLHAILVFIVVMALYRLVTYLIDKNDRIEELLEGKAVYLIEEGRFMLENFKKEPIAHEEFFALMRLNHVSHLGQVQQAIIEINGDLSLFYYEDNEVKHGLPILPHLCSQKIEYVTVEDYYACSFCGNTEKLKPAAQHTCPVCQKTVWVKAINNKRLS